MQESYLIVDSSSGSVRAYVMTPDGDVLAQRRRDIKNNKDLHYPDALSFDPSLLEKDLLAVCAEAVAAVPNTQIIAVSATSQREGIVLIDAQGNPLGGYPNIDNRGQAWEQTITDRHLVYSLGGRWVSTLFPAVKLLGLRSVYPELWRRTSRIISISDWIGYLFTGEFGYESSQAGETLLFDIRTGSWSEELCEIFQISKELLPPVLRSGTLLGKIQSKAAKAIGLPEGIPFIVGGADTQMAIESCRPSAGDLIIVAGTTTPIAYLSSQYLVDEKERCWVDRHVRADLFVVETNVGVSGMNYDHAIQLFYPGSMYAEVEAELAARPQENCLASVGSMIFHQGKVTPKGAFFIDAPLRDDLSRADFVLAVLMDYVFSFKTNFDQLMDIVPKERGRIYGVGGGFLGKLLPQFFADITGAEISVPKGFAYASCIGLVNQINQYWKHRATTSEILYTLQPRQAEGLQAHYEEWAQKRILLNQ